MGFRQCPRGDLNTNSGEISPIRGNHAASLPIGIGVFEYFAACRSSSLRQTPLGLPARQWPHARIRRRGLLCRTGVAFPFGRHFEPDRVGLNVGCSGDAPSGTGGAGWSAPRRGRTAPWRSRSQHREAAIDLTHSRAGWRSSMKACHRAGRSRPANPRAWMRDQPRRLRREL